MKQKHGYTWWHQRNTETDGQRELWEEPISDGNHGDLYSGFSGIPRLASQPMRMSHINPPARAPARSARSSHPNPSELQVYAIWLTITNHPYRSKPPTTSTIAFSHGIRVHSRVTRWALVKSPHLLFAKISREWI